MLQYLKKEIDAVKHALLLLKAQAYKAIQMNVNDIRVLRRTSMQVFQYLERRPRVGGICVDSYVGCSCSYCSSYDPWIVQGFFCNFDQVLPRNLFLRSTRTFKCYICSAGQPFLTDLVQDRRDQT